MPGVVVVDADRLAVERTRRNELEGVTLDDRRELEREALQVLLELLTRRAAHREVVDRDEVGVVVADHRADQARAAVGPDLDIALAGLEHARGEVEEREVVLAREPFHLVQDPREPAPVRVRRDRELVEERVQRRFEPVDVQGR